MKARAFEYAKATSLQDAFDAFARASGDCCYLAGGQSLIPSLSLRLQAPSLLIDISGIGDMRGVGIVDGMLRIGALTRHAEMLTSPEIARHAPLLRLAAPHVAHPAIRNKGTIGGTIALADPAAEFPAVVLALDAELEIAGPGGRRRTKADGFFKGLYETGLEPGEILTAILVRPFDKRDRCAFDELARRRGDYAIVGAGVQGRFHAEQVEALRIAFLSVGPAPVRARNAESAVRGRTLSPAVIADAQATLHLDLDPAEDAQTSRATRLHLARVLLGRLLGKLAREARNEGGRA
ncbi:MAG: xanthine dehydrogenase family protein subunit M [Hyphomicrobiaceae bacterium]|nr:MAG: xanthine dehydrogenase family protein subunit M [Hyphomicrobiaceae bacterium]